MTTRRRLLTGAAALVAFSSLTARGARATIINSRDAVTTLSVSGGGTVVSGGTTASGTWSSARSDIGVTSGLYYIECNITGNTNAGGLVNGAIAVGVHTVTSPLNSVPGSGTGQFYFPWSGLTFNSGSTGTLQAVASGSVTVDIALDLTHSKIWWRPNNGNWNNAAIGSQDPASNLGGMSFTASANGTFPGVGIAASGPSVTFNFGATAYTRTPPTGFGACPTSGLNGNTMYWNASDAKAGLTPYDNSLNALSNVSTAGWSSMRSTPSFSAGGKWYWEVKYLVTPSNQLMVGAMNASGTLSNFCGFDTHGVGNQSSGPTFYNNASGGVSGSAAVSGDIIGIAIDGVHSKMWSRLNNSGWFNALIGAQDPASNVGGVPCAGLFTGGNIMAAISMFASGFAVLANFGQTAFANAAPSGFVGPYTSVPTGSTHFYTGFP